MIKESFIGEFEKIVGKENVLTSKEALRAYSYDGTTSWIHEPDVVLFPTSSQQISAIMKIANAERIPVTPRGGGTNVSGTGQIGCILLRKTEKVKQGWRVEFVCGKRAVATARRDYATLTEAASLFSSHLEDVPQQIKKAQEETRASRKSREQLLEELADLHAARLLAETPESTGRKVVIRTYPDRDLTFIKLLAQRLTRQSTPVVALLGATSNPPALVFAESPGLPFDMGALMREALAQLGGRGGGSKEMAQGGPGKVEGLDEFLTALARRSDLG